MHLSVKYSNCLQYESSFDKLIQLWNRGILQIDTVDMHRIHSSSEEIICIMLYNIIHCMSGDAATVYCT